MSKEYVCLLAMLATLTMTALPLHAEITVDEYRDAVAKGGGDLAAVDAYVHGLGSSFMAANAILGIQKQPPLYCQPSKLALEVSNYRRILDDTLAPVLKDPRTPSIPIALFLLKGLQKMFPCSN